MIKQVGKDNVRNFIHKLNDIQLLLYVDEFRKFKHNEEVLSSVLWNDIDQFLGFLVLECVERFRDITVEDECLQDSLSAEKLYDDKVLTE